MINEYEIIDLVDEDDKVVGSINRENAHSRRCHNIRVVGIFLINPNKKILVPTRNDNKQLFPGCFDFSVAGHVKSNETYESAALRETEEELGIKICASDLIEFLYCKYPNALNISSFSKYYYITNFYQTITPSTEIKSFCYLSISEVLSLYNVYPYRFKSDYYPVLMKLTETLNLL